jgi:hypothetical protein
MGALDPSEVRKGLAQEEEFEIEGLLDGVDVGSDNLWGGEGLPAEPAEPVDGAGPNGALPPAGATRIKNR